MRAKDALGRYGEDVAARFLSEKGYRLLATNWRCSQGELDIIAIDGVVLVFVEVKTRSSTRFGVPAEAVNRVKAARLRTLAGAWLAEHRPRHDGLRFDVISVLSSRAGAAQVEHLQGVI
jgi:putative endonuclease